MKYAFACVALAGCVPVSWRVSPHALAAAAPELRANGSADVDADKSDDVPANTAPLSANATERIRLDQPIRVRLSGQALPWHDGEPASAPQSTTVADLLADCPDDLDNSEANRLAYPRCKLFRAGGVEVRRGQRADDKKLVVLGAIAAVAGGIVCGAECPRDVGAVALGGVVVGGGAGLVYLYLHALTSGDYKH